MPNSPRRSNEILMLAVVYSVLQHGEMAIRCPWCEFSLPFPTSDPVRSWRYVREHIRGGHGTTARHLSDELMRRLLMIVAQESTLHIHAHSLNVAVDGDYDCGGDCQDPPFCAARVAQGMPLPCERKTPNDRSDVIIIDGLSIDPNTFTILPIVPTHTFRISHTEETL